MPPLKIKRNEPIVTAVRRSAERQLDIAIESLTGADAPRPQRARREMLRLQALLHLVRRPLAADVFRREHKVVVRSLKLLPPRPVDFVKLIAPLAEQTPAIDLAPLVEQVAVSTPQAEPPAKPGPDPRMLRLVADLAEMRMRARYWHLPDGGFELLAPGLRQSYQRASRVLIQSDDAAATQRPDAIGRLGLQLQTLESACPLLLQPMRKALRELQQEAQHHAELIGLRGALVDHSALLSRLDAALETDAARAALRQQLFAETAAAFTKRIGSYWDAWRA